MNFKKIKVALVHDFLIKIGGAEKVLKVLIDIFPQADIFTLIYDQISTKGEFIEKNIYTSNIQKYPRFLRSRQKLLISKFPFEVEQYDLSKYDLVISSSNSFAHGVITGPSTLHICYCYSPMRYVWDWYHQYLIENNINRGILSFLIKSKLSQIRIWDRLAADRPDGWISISKTVRERIKKYYGKDSTVIYPPTEISKIDLSEIKDNGYYLIISRLSPYKKIALAVEAFNINRKELIVIGEGSELEKIKKMAKSNIKIIGWQNNTKVNYYLSRCRCLIFPGEEDFGLTPIEAMSRGKPVIAYNRGGVSETVIEGKTGTFFTEINPKSINCAVKHFENNLKITAKDCIEQANKFSKDKFIKDFKSEITKYMQKHAK